MNKQNELTVTILAGGLGKRMQSYLPKVLHKVNGMSMIYRILYELWQGYDNLKIKKILIVVGKYKDIIKETIEDEIKFWKITDLLNIIEYVMQDEPLGTGHAVLCTLQHIDDDGINLILNGDTPMLKYETLEEVITYYMNNNNRIQITAIDSINPAGCGRIIIKNNVFEKIIEEKDCSELERKISIINCGIYVIDNNTLKKYIPLIQNNNIQKEFYLTDIVDIYRNNTNEQLGLFIIDKSKEHEIVNINTKDQLDNLNDLIIKNKY